MKKVLEILKIVASLIPVIVQAIKAIEEAIPDKGQGAQKLTIIRTMVEQAFGQIEQASVAFQDVWPIVESTVGGFVKLFKSTGLFQ